MIIWQSYHFSKNFAIESDELADVKSMLNNIKFMITVIIIMRDILRRKKVLHLHHTITPYK